MRRFPILPFALAPVCLALTLAACADAPTSPPSARTIARAVTLARGACDAIEDCEVVYPLGVHATYCNPVTRTCGALTCEFGSTGWVASVEASPIRYDPGNDLIWMQGYGWVDVNDPNNPTGWFIDRTTGLCH